MNSTHPVYVGLLATFIVSLFHKAAHFHQAFVDSLHAAAAALLGM